MCKFQSLVRTQKWIATTGSDLFTEVLWGPSTRQHGTRWPMQAPGIPVPLKINELSEDYKRTPSGHRIIIELFGGKYL